VHAGLYPSSGIREPRFFGKLGSSSVAMLVSASSYAWYQLEGGQAEINVLKSGVIEVKMWRVCLPTTL
jgi:hypothetical protein